MIWCFSLCIYLGDGFEAYAFFANGRSSNCLIFVYIYICIAEFAMSYLCLVLFAYSLMNLNFNNIVTVHNDRNLYDLNHVNDLIILNNSSLGC